MPAVAGAPLASLFDAIDRLNQTLPGDVSRFVERLAATDLQSRVSDGAIIHTGRIQALDAAAGRDVESFDLSFGTLKIPLVTAGLPFRLAFRRAAVAGSLEPGAASWQFDLLMDSFELTLNGLVAADFVAASGTTPRHLAPRPGRPPAAIVGAAALRFERSAASQPVVVRLMDPAGGDPFAPDAPSGFVASVAMSPPHALVGSSQFGFSLRNALFDFSRTHSPAFVIERGQSADWVGFAIEEAAIYCPRNAVGKGGFSLSARDLLIGDPAGLQAEIEVQFGASPLNPATFVFEQDGADVTSGFDFDRGTLQISAAAGEAVDLTARLTVPAPPAGSDVSDYDAEFQFPGAAPQSGDSASGLVRHGDVLRITPIEVLGTGAGARRLRKPAFAVRIVASGTAPKVAARLGAARLENVVELSGSVEGAAAATLAAEADPPDPAARFEWSCPTLGVSRVGAELPLTFAPDARGVHLLTVRQLDAQSGPSRVRLHLRDPGEGATLIGCAAGVFDAAAPAAPTPPDRVRAVYDLETFHAHGRLEGADASATIVGARVDVPAGALALVELNEGGAAPVEREDRHIQILFAFDSDDLAGWGDAHAPIGNAGSDQHEALLEWAANYSGDVTFVVIGRCDDVGSDAYNVGLGQRRAEKAASLLRTPTAGRAAVSAPVLVLQEQDLSALPADARALIEPDAAERSGRLVMDPAIVDRSTWPRNPDGTGVRANPPDVSRENVRKQYRRADIIAVGGVAASAARARADAGAAPTQRLILVPAADRTPAPADNDAARADCRVMLKLGWDRARFSGWKDLVPNLAEFEYAWTPAPDDGVSVTAEVLTVFGKWVHDELTGFTEFLIGLGSEGDSEGIVDVEQPNLVAALTFGPMLASGVDFSEHAVESGVRLAALAGLAAFAGADFGGGGPLIGAGSRTAFTRLTAKARTRTIADPLRSYTVQLLVDYANTVHVNAGALGLRTDPAQPMKIRYSDVGVEFDNTDPDAPLIEKIGLAQSSKSMSIEDSGLWRIDGPLGRLLRVTEFKMGTGSLWFEPTLAVAIDVGVVEISEAAFRVTFRTDDAGRLSGAPEFSLRGLTARADIPGALKGEGRIRIEEGGLLRAGVDATLIPIQTRASVALAAGVPDDPPDFAPSLFLSLYGKVQFPGGIPLGPLPLAIHGFVGQTVVNGARATDAVEDVVARELGWWRKAPERKYAPAKGAHALGLGAVVGTLPDASFSFAATGMVVVAFPDVEVIFGVEVSILSLPDTTAREKKEGDSAAIAGLVVVNEQAATVAVSAAWSIDKLLELKVPFAAHFPHDGKGYVRIGSDGGPGRAGEPVTITFLPDILNVKVWAFLMIEGGGLPAFGPNRDWNFDGFSIGFGAGATLEWKAGKFGLSVSGAIYVGMGTDPLFIKGGMYLRGTLDLVVVSATVDAAAVVSYLDPPDSGAVAAIEEARFCASVDLFFFTVEGCVTLSFGASPPIAAPAPPPPIASVSLTDRLNRVAGEATEGAPEGRPIYDFVEIDGVMRNQGAEPARNNTVWPDTVPVINFRHFIADAMPSGGQFDPGAQPAGEPWFGSNRLRYAYRLTGLRLVRDADGTPVADPSGAPLLSAWTHTPARPADDASAQAPSGAEATHLQLLNREPWAWAQSTAQGGAGQPGDPAGVVERVCERIPAPRPACLRGADARILGPTAARLRRAAPAPGPYPSGFQGVARAYLPLGSDEATGADLAALVNATGAVLQEGAMRAAPAAVLADGPADRAYRLPRAMRVGEGGPTATALPWRIELDRAVRDGALTLLVCEDAPRPEGGDEDAACYRFEDLTPGAQAERFDLPPFVISALQRANVARRNLLRARDRIDLSNVADPRPGADGGAEVEVSDPGAVIAFKRPCRDLELLWFKPSDGRVILRASHADGSVEERVFDTPSARPAMARLTSQGGIVAVEMLTDGVKAFQLLRVCCRAPVAPAPETGRACVDFAALRHDEVARAKFTHDGVRFEALNPRERFALSDRVDARGAPARRGVDGAAELMLPPGGVRVTLPRGCGAVELSVMLGAAAVKATGFDAGGDPVAQALSPEGQDVEHVLTLSGRAPIVSVVIEGGSGEAFLFRLCCLAGGAEASPVCVDLDDLPRELDGAPEIAREGLRIRPLARGHGLKLTDMAERPARQGEPPRPGRDGRAELLIPDPGLELTLAEGCADLELTVLLMGAPVKAIGFDAAGARAAQAVAEGAGRVHVLRLSAGAPIKRVALAGGANEAALLRVCCRAGPIAPPMNRCVTLGKLKLPEPAAEAVFEGLTLRDPDGRATLRSALARGARAGGLGFGARGLEIALGRAASLARLRLRVRPGAAYRIDAFDSEGRRVAGEGGRAAGPDLRATLRGERIARLLVRVKGAAALVEICLRETGPAGAAPEPAADAGAGPLMPEVLGRAPDGAEGAWAAQLVSSHRRPDGGACYVVRYRMPDAPEAVTQIRVKARKAGQDIAFVGLCAVDDRAARWRAADQDTRDEVADQIESADPIGAGRPVILDPDTVYRIEADWEYQAWLSEDEDVQPPAAPTGAWTPGGTQSFRFRTAAEPAALPARQDGPNEHIFDPRDIDRMLTASAPQTGDIAHFTRDPVVFHFAHDHVADLLARYGRELRIELRRTDPPPRPGGSLSGAAAQALAGAVRRAGAPLELLTPAERAVVEAARAAPCLTNRRPAGGVSLAGTYPLEPDVFHDAELWAARIADPADRALVTAANFRTSRYADPAQMIAALGCATDGSVAPVPAEELILEDGASPPPAAAEAPSDRLFDQAMAGMGLGELGLPRGRARLFQIWSVEGGAPRTVAFLVDALEPLNRKAHVLAGDEVALVDRCRLTGGRHGGVALIVARINRNATRALLLPEAPIPPEADPAGFGLFFETSDGALTGRRQMRARPLTFDLEGF
ncbi:hypothetical protein [Oceanicella actignis]|uniref:hypothetical protein n=1 Tax=Oceanicella actignis TaxID=1189325 RepID=UPI0011E87CF0|nr:hypothetical protein [Oceanicella actignis]TYO85380.1 outer membrane protein OmpA-like peptidoglycan-associated protein [Oceanicella actignis]